MKLPWGLQTTYGENDTSEWFLKSYKNLMTETVDKILISSETSFLNTLGDIHSD